MSFSISGPISITGPYSVSTAAPVSADIPITNPLIQWYLSPNNYSVSSSYSTSQVFNTGSILPSAPSVDWSLFTTTYGAVSVSSYNRPSDSTPVKYFVLPRTCNFQTTSDQFNYSAINSNNGYTVWMVYFCNWGTTYKRILQYAGSGSVNNTDPSNQTSQYSNIIVFGSSTRLEPRIGTSTNSNSSYFGFSHTAAQGSIIIQVFSVNEALETAPTVNNITHSLYSFDPTTGVVSTNSIGAPGSGDSSLPVNFGLQNTTSARPAFNDSQYNQAGQTQSLSIIEAGFSNRPYSSGEHTTLVNWLVSRFK